MATAMGQIIGGTIPLVYFLRKNSSSLRLRRPKWDGGALRRACINGVSELMSSISMSIVGMLYNAQLMRYAGENGVAAYGTIMYVDFIFLAIFIGYATGVAPVISYHYGAGNKKELNNLLKRSVVLIAAASLSMLLLSEVMAAPLAAIFVGHDGTCVFHLCGFVLILRFFHFQFRLFYGAGRWTDLGADSFFAYSCV